MTSRLALLLSLALHAIVLAVCSVVVAGRGDEGALAAGRPFALACRRDAPEPKLPALDVPQPEREAVPPPPQDPVVPDATVLTKASEATLAPLERVDLLEFAVGECVPTIDPAELADPRPFAGTRPLREGPSGVSREGAKVASSAAAAARGDESAAARGSATAPREDTATSQRSAEGEDEVATTFAPAPIYPRAALRDRLEGRVVLLALVTADGKVEACEVLESSGHACFDDAARAGLLLWRFKPRFVDGVAKPFAARVPVRFERPAN